MPSQNPRKAFPLWYLPNGTKNASDGELELSGESCERWGWRCGALVVIGLIAEVAIAWSHPSYNSFCERWGSVLADALVTIGVAGEILFSRMAFRRDKELKRRSDEKVAESNERAATALQRAEEERHARIKLESQLLPRELTQEQFTALQALKGKYEAINVAYETDIETGHFANAICSALMAAGIRVGQFLRHPAVQSVASLVYDGAAIEANPMIESELRRVIRVSNLFRGAYAIVTSLPPDIVAPADIPMLIVAGRFVLPPPHIAHAQEMFESARTNKTADKSEK
jgi:hypothetical protein